LWFYYFLKIPYYHLEKISRPPSSEGAYNTLKATLFGGLINLKKYISALIGFLLLFSISFAAIDFDINCSSAILINAKNGEILYEYNAYDKSYPASTTKVLTALLALENENDYSKEIIPSHYAIYSVPVGSSIAYFSEDEKLNFEQVLYGLLLPSGNDAANIIAEEIGGSISNFVSMMNDRAIELGAKNTNFTNPSGSHDNNHYTTAYDLSLFAKEAMKHEKFREIISTSSYVMPSTNRSDVARTFTNTNKLLAPNHQYYYEYATGMKTGYTSSARNCLIASASRNGVELISVVLGGTTTSNGKSAIYTDSRNLLDYGFSCYEKTTIGKEGDTITQVTPKRSKGKVSVVAVLKDNIRMVHKTKETPTFTTEVKINEDLTAPINKGDIVGTISYYDKDGLVAETELIADNTVEKEPWYSVVFRFIVRVIVTIILIFISLIILLIIFNKIRKFRNRNKERIFY